MQSFILGIVLLSSFYNCAAMEGSEASQAIRKKERKKNGDLITAIEGLELNDVKKAIKNGASVNRMRSTGQTVLMFAAYDAGKVYRQPDKGLMTLPSTTEKQINKINLLLEKQRDIVQELIAEGADVQAVDTKNQTIMEYIFNAQKELAQKTKSSIVTREYLERPLINGLVLEVLEEAGANIMCVTDYHEKIKVKFKVITSKNLEDCEKNEDNCTIS